MSGILLTQNSTFIIGQVSQVLGMIMNGIFHVLDFIGIPNIGLSIILFTIVIYLLMMPLTIKQQKFSKLSAKMNPELQAVQAKYKNKKDNDSMMAMNAETQAIYAKYGVSPTGSCVQLIIQMPILFALYRVIYSMPAYVTKLGDAFGVLADKIMGSAGGVEYVQAMSTATQFTSNFAKDDNTRNAIIDVLNKVSSTEMAELSSKFDLSSLTYNGNLILSNDTTRGLIDQYNNFLGLNIGDSPSYMFNQALQSGAVLMIIAAFAIPVLSAVTQWINVKLMPQQDTSGKDKNDQASAMASSMKTMNMMMPLMSAFFCFTLPAGMGLYWIAGSVVRSIQQIVINRHIDKMDLNQLIEKNKEKSSKKMEKAKEKQAKLAQYASVNTKNIDAMNRMNVTHTKNVYTEKAKQVGEKASTAETPKPSSNSKPGSLMAKANAVKDFNERNNK